MTAKHETREYRRNAPLVRAQVRALWRVGDDVRCWRGGGLIRPGQPFDVGHVAGADGSALTDLAPEHRHATPGCCRGNRAHGGRVGAAITNGRSRPSGGEASTWVL